MASIDFKNLQAPKSGPISKSTYIDIRLDLQEDNVPNVSAGNNITRSRDLAISTDIQAINNSLKNLFSTVPGERILNPQYGSSLLKYVFEPVHKNIASAIGQDIRYAVETWEPRVVFTQPVKVYMREDQHEYRIVLSLYVPSLKIDTEFSGILSRNGFVETNPSNVNTRRTTTYNTVRKER